MIAHIAFLAAMAISAIVFVWLAIMALPLRHHSAGLVTLEDWKRHSEPGPRT